MGKDRFDYSGFDIIDAEVEDLPEPASQPTMAESKPETASSKKDEAAPKTYNSFFESDAERHALYVLLAIIGVGILAFIASAII